jgi:hypothetical protein
MRLYSASLNDADLSEPPAPNPIRTIRSSRSLPRWIEELLARREDIQGAIESLRASRPERAHPDDIAAMLKLGY